MTTTLGSVIYYDLLRMTRSDRLFLARLAYLCGVFLFLLFALAGDARNMPLRAAQFYGSLLGLEQLCVLVFTPLIACGSISDEKERGTLTNLLVSQLNDSEIIFGKLLSRAGLATMVLAGGVPILSLVTLIGGVDPRMVLIDFLYILTLLAGIASMCVYFSVTCSSSLAAWFWSYGTISLYAIFLAFAGESRVNPVFNLFPTVSAELSGMATLFGAPAFLSSLNLVGAAVFAVAALLRFRPLALAQLSAEKEAHKDPKTAHRGRRKAPELGDREAMMWKELYFEDAFAIQVPTWLIMILTAVGILTFAPMIALRSLGQSQLGLESNARFVTATATAVGGFLCYVSIACSAASRVVRERERQTMDVLQMLPFPAPYWLTAKWWGSLLAGRQILALLIVLWVLALLAGVISPWHFLLLLVHMSASSAFLVSLGLYFSSVCRSTLQAILVTLAIFGVIVVVPLVATESASIVGALVWLCLNGDTTELGTPLVALALYMFFAVRLWQRTTIVFDADDRLERDPIPWPFNRF